ncbi:hypothetical protein HD553DRAFT_346809 [Filobasidium floriforme]|uniref:uncharacterized protein n=1 Tax=Filobasidium floriforme TaxID=5210 RepID=UPI001E8D60FF|nr:uncharacterized protein HD553DRAFT_346809 [Filobasidium floriforme]KAH8090295.1 hypothetical protein HD553DRAFT_346809 [Filobasidium floriforme]
MWSGRTDLQSADPDSVGSDRYLRDGNLHKQHVKGDTPDEDSEEYRSGSEEGSVVLVQHVPEIYSGGSGNDGPKEGELRCNTKNDRRAKATDHLKLKKKRKSKNAKRFSNIAKSNRQIIQSARRARRIRGEAHKDRVSSNPMHIDNLITHENVDAKKQQNGNTDRVLPDPIRLPRRAARTALQHLSKIFSIPMAQLDPLLLSPKIYAYAPSRIPEHPGLDQLDVLMIGWENQQGGEGTVERVGLELACAWVLAWEMKEDASLPYEIEQRLIAALDKLAYE